MDKKALQDVLVDAYLAKDEDVLTIEHVYQERPNTFAIVTLNHKKRTEFGFAKCCGATKRHGPDVWDAAYGRDMAIRKAIAKIARGLTIEVEEENE